MKNQIAQVLASNDGVTFCSCSRISTPCFRNSMASLSSSYTPRGCSSWSRSEMLTSPGKKRILHSVHDFLIRIANELARLASQIAFTANQPQCIIINGLGHPI